MFKNYYHDCVESWLRNKSSLNTNTTVKVIQLNIRGLNELSKFDRVRELLDRFRERVDIIVLGETWLTNDKTGLYFLNGYTGFFSCRDDQHGGLALFIRNDLKFNLCSNRTIDGFHHIHIQLLTKGKQLQVHAVYRPPSFDARRFWPKSKPWLRLAIAIRNAYCLETWIFPLI